MCRIPSGDFRNQPTIVGTGSIRACLAIVALDPMLFDPRTSDLGPLARNLTLQLLLAIAHSLLQVIQALLHFFLSLV